MDNLTLICPNCKLAYYVTLPFAIDGKGDINLRFHRLICPYCKFDHVDISDKFKITVEGLRQIIIGSTNATQELAKVITELKECVENNRTYAISDKRYNFLAAWGPITIVNLWVIIQIIHFCCNVFSDKSKTANEINEIFISSYNKFIINTADSTKENKKVYTVYKRMNAKISFEDIKEITLDHDIVLIIDSPDIYTPNVSNLSGFSLNPKYGKFMHNKRK